MPGPGRSPYPADITGSLAGHTAPTGLSGTQAGVINADLLAFVPS
jgi:hypothetical protein